MRGSLSTRHHAVMFRRRRREPLFTREEVNGLLIILMRIDENIARIARAEEEDNGEAPEE